MVLLLWSERAPQSCVVRYGCRDLTLWNCTMQPCWRTPFTLVRRPRWRLGAQECAWLAFRVRDAIPGVSVEGLVGVIWRLGATPVQSPWGSSFGHFIMPVVMFRAQHHWWLPSDLRIGVFGVALRDAAAVHTICIFVSQWLNSWFLKHGFQIIVLGLCCLCSGFWNTGFKSYFWVCVVYVQWFLKHGFQIIILGLCCLCIGFWNTGFKSYFWVCVVYAVVSETRVSNHIFGSVLSV